MRFRDRVFEDDWEKKTIETRTFSPILLAHHFFGVAAIAIILLQSAISLNIYVFTIWLILGLIILLLDLTRGNKLTLSSELIFGFFFILGTALSLLLGNFTSMFFPDSLGRIEITLFQVSAGICVVIRFILSLYFIEFKANEGFHIVPTSIYSQEQLKHYQDNLVLTDFERKKNDEDRFLKKLGFLLQRMLWPSVILLILVLIAIAYSFMIYFVIPNDSIAEIVVRPSLIVIAMLYTVLLIRTHTILPKIIEKQKPPADKDEETEEIAEMVSEEDEEIIKENT
ncbi:MAG: hypothetical protein GOP50_06025 [Candidatus Heimdallarchaeota archaeon]|nr:hypothetical protein [Candidatus Heimdallarchaeota archaeon]